MSHSLGAVLWTASVLWGIGCIVLSFKTFNSVIKVLLVLGLFSILCDVWGASLRAECWLELLLSLKSILLRRHFCFLLSNAARTSLFLTTWRTKIKNPYNDKNEDSLSKHNTDGTRSMGYLIRELKKNRRGRWRRQACSKNISALSLYFSWACSCFGYTVSIFAELQLPSTSLPKRRDRR